jgi:hypothetical protein
MKQALLFILSLIIGIVVVLVSTIIFPHQSKLLASPLPQTHFSLEDAPTDSLRGTIATFSGEVQWQSRTATMPAALTVTRTLQQGEEVVTGDDGTLTLLFPTLLRIALKPNTSLSALQTIPNALVFAQQTGSATYTQLLTTPLSVRSRYLLIQQNAGTMTVMVDADTGDSTIAVLQGSVTVAYNDSANVSTVQTISEGNTFIFQGSNRQGIIKSTTKASTYFYNP